LVVGVGLLLMPLPGPGGTPVALAGLAILAAEVPWARRLLQRLKERLRPLRSGRVWTTGRWLRVGLAAGLFASWIVGGIIAWRMWASIP
jgi:hypothetical protein